MKKGNGEVDITLYEMRELINFGSVKLKAEKYLSLLFPFFGAEAYIEMYRIIFVSIGQ